ncbi:MAG TPA: CAP domain-containing protein [Terracidiphilus sp.]
MRTFLLAALPALAAAQIAAQGSNPGSGNLQAEARQIFALTNQARAQAGVGPVEWDPALAAAALAHCRRMAREGPIAHQYGGEADLTERAAQAGARFSVIEENVAVGPSPDAIQEGWMQSPGHRANLLSPDVDRVGVAVVAARGELYAVTDFSRGVEQLSATEVEARIAALVRVSGVMILRDPSLARAACATGEGMPRAAGDAAPRFVMRWQAADLNELPQALKARLASGNYRQAAVGSCPAQVSGGAFTAYRVAVILY